MHDWGLVVKAAECSAPSGSSTDEGTGITSRLRAPAQVQAHPTAECAASPSGEDSNNSW